MEPRHIDLDREVGLTIEWEDGSSSSYPIAYLRRMSPSADARQQREALRSDPLAVLPASGSGDGGGALRAVGAELVGNYAIRIRFSDGHDTGIFSWQYLRGLDRTDPDRSGG